MQTVYFHVFLPVALRRCDGILTVSEVSKQQLVAIYGIDPRTVHVVPNAIDLSYYHDASVKLHHPDHAHPYLLMVGASWKHKNAMAVLEHHALWKQNFRLKIVAGAGQYAKQLRERSLALGISAKVDFVQDVTDLELAALYRSCSALVYPSSMEGFGLPPLEAMAWGKPVLISDIPVFRELFGDVPTFIKLDETSSWKQAFDGLTNKANMEGSEQMQRRIDLASSYSTQRMCDALNAALEDIWHLPKSKTAIF